MAFLVFLASACLYCIASGRHFWGLLLCIGFSQDMVRKLTPGEPIIFIVTVGVLFGAILVAIVARRGLSYVSEPYFRWSGTLQAPVILFIVILVLQFFHSLVRYGNPVVGLIGLVTYIAPFLGVIVGYYLVQSVEDIRRLTGAYIALGLVVATTVVMSFMGYDWAVLREIGQGIRIYDQGTVLRSYSGVMRSGEIAAWHISMAACLIVTLAVSSKNFSTYAIVIALVVFMMVAVTLTGRRKMLMLFSLYMLSYVTVYFYYRKSLDRRYFFTIFYLALLGWFTFEVVNLGTYNESLSNYIARGSSVFGDASGRFVELGIKPVQWAYNRVGLFGGGLGIASQGGYLFNVSDVAGGSGEGGLGKIMVELGLPGLICLMWLGIAGARYLNNALQLANQKFASPELLPLMTSLSVILGVNAITFSVATQVYGDVFVLVVLGTLAGCLLALPKIVARQVQERQLQTVVFRALQDRPSGLTAS